MFKVKKTQKGFALTETILLLVIVALIAFTAWYAFHTKGNTDATLGTAANTQTLPSKNQTTPSSNTSKTSAANQVVTTKSNSKVGQYLADTSGKTLYTYSGDTAGKSNCTGSCLTDWPVYVASSSSTALPANITIITRSDGGTQYAYKGKPLYYFTGDTSAGMVTGNGVSGFSAAKP